MSYPIFRVSDYNVNQIVDFRHKLFDNKYEPIPVLGQAKMPKIGGWNGWEITHQQIEKITHAHLDHLSTGLRTGREGGLVAVDIDLRDPDHAEIISELTQDLIGRTPLRRFGSKGMMLCYRGEKFGKLFCKQDRKTLIEIFGVGQFVGFGVHPDTHEPYRWVGEGDPLTVPLNELPSVSFEQMLELREAIVEWLNHPQLGYKVEAGEHNAPRADLPPPAPIGSGDTITAMFLRLVPRGKRGGTGWLNFTCPHCLCRDNRAGLMETATGGFRFQCFHSACVFHKATGWEPDGRLGPRTRDLYVLLGGDPAELTNYEKELKQLERRRFDEQYAERIKETDYYIQTLRGKI